MLHLLCVDLMVERFWSSMGAGLGVFAHYYVTAYNAK